MEEVPKVCPTCGVEAPATAHTCPHDGAALVSVDAGTLIRDPLIGHQVGEYIIRRSIGAGGMGLVYEALHPIIGKRAAIKILKPELAEDPEQMRRLLAEAKAIASISHRSVIDIFGFGELGDGRHYMVMEFLDGEPLDYALHRQGRLGLPDALSLLDQIASALGAAHAVGVIHRDLKPSNIILLTQPDGSREVKVLDFGLAKQASKPNETTPQTNASRMLGTPEYMAPEQARGQAVGPQTDLYALGIIAFEMVVGKRPFSGPSLVEVLIKHANELPVAPSSLEPTVPAAYDDLVLKLLAKAPEDRPASAEAVRQELARISNPVPTANQRMPRTRSSTENGRRGMGGGMVPAALAAEPGESTEPAGRSALGTSNPALVGVDSTLPDLKPVRSRSAVTTQPEADAARNGVSDTAKSLPPVSGVSPLASPSEPGLLVLPRRSKTPFIVAGSLVVVAALAFALWPRTPQVVETVVPRPPIAELPDLTKPVTPVTPVVDAGALAVTPQPLEVDGGPAEPDAGMTTASVKTPTKRPPASSLSKAALTKRLNALAKKLGTSRSRLDAAFLEDTRDALKGSPSLEDRRQIGEDLDAMEARFLKR